MNPSVNLAENDIAAWKSHLSKDPISSRQAIGQAMLSPLPPPKAPTINVQQHRTSETNMKHSIRKISRHTAHIAFEIVDKIHPTGSLKIWRIHTDTDGSVSRAEGKLLGENPKEPRAAIVKVRRGDLVIIYQRISSGGMEPLQKFTISGNFEPLIKECHLPGEPGVLPFDRIVMDDDRNSNFDTSDLKILFRRRRPEWLQYLMDDQLECWRDHTAPLFLGIAPHHLLVKNIELLVTHDPHRALRDYKSLLNRGQLQRCIREQPSAAMRLAFENVPRALRKKHLASHATYLLDNHLQQLTNSELRICSKKDPKTAFKLRSIVAPRRHAIMLAHSYGVVWHTLFGDDRAPFRDETLDSLARYPDEWLAVNEKGFKGIFSKLSNLLGIRLEPVEFQSLVKQMAPRGRQALAEYIAPSV